MTTIELSHYSSVIFDILDSQKENLSREDKKAVVDQLQRKNWVYVNGEFFAPHQFLNIKSSSLIKYLPQIIEISNGKYISINNLRAREIELLSKYGLSTEFNVYEIIKYVLNSETPHLNAIVICDAIDELFKQKDGKKIDEEVEYLLSETEWITYRESELSHELDEEYETSSVISPASIIVFNEIDDLENILSQSQGRKYIAISQVTSDIAQSEGFQHLKKQANVFLADDKALEIIGQIISEFQNYWIGDLQDDNFQVLWEVLRKIPSSESLGWGLASQLSQKKFRILFDRIRETPEDSSWVVCLLNYISDSNPTPDEKAIKAYNCYLSIAYEAYEDFSEVIITNIKLLNQNNEWKTPSELCWEEDQDAKINKNFLLNKEHRSILHEYLISLIRPPIPSTESERNTNKSSGNNFDILRRYFQSWEDRTRSQFIGAFLSLLTKDEPDLEKLAQGYLSRNIDLFRSRVLKRSGLKSVRISVEHSQSSLSLVFSASGSWIHVPRSDSYQSEIIEAINKDVEIAEIHLNQFDLDGFQESLENALNQATRKVISSLYGVPVIQQEFDSLWNELRSRQLDIQVAKNFILKGAPYVLRELGLHKNHQKLNEILQRWDKQRRDEAELEAQNLTPQEAANQWVGVNWKIKTIIKEISDLFESDSEDGLSLRAESLNAVRKKIKDFGYEIDSIPFEIFQNADDAVVEMDEISSDTTINWGRNKFIVDWSESQITFMHWGRPINMCWTSSDINREHKHEGFDRDLEKMLVFNISDKSSGKTGKFGLGFKSVHLFTSYCQVVSSELAFTVAGGLLPSKLSSKTDTQADTKKVIVSQASLKEEMKQFSELNDGTLIRLNADSSTSLQTKEVIDSFQRLLPLLLIFARRIHQATIRSYRSQKQVFEWKPNKILNISGAEIQKVELHSSLSIVNVHQHRLLCLRPQDEGNEIECAALLLGFISKGNKLESSLSRAVPTFWVTAPTEEKLDIDFVINAKFDVTTGRESLVKGSSFNLELAQKIGKGLGLLLVELFSKSESDQGWEDFVSDLDMNNLKQYDFWYFMWNSLVKRWQQISDSASAENMLGIIRLALGGEQGMGYLVTHVNAIPTGLWGNYQQLVGPQQLEYVIDGILATENCFQQVANWPKFKSRYRNNLILKDILVDLENLLLREIKLDKLQLIDILRLEISGPSKNVDDEQAKRLGYLIKKTFLEGIADKNELEKIQTFLGDLSFKAKDNQYYLGKSLLLSVGDNNKEEKLLAGFAPKDRLLSQDYTGDGLDFFMACRRKRDDVNTDTLVDWVLNAEESQYRAVLDYLLEGNDRDSLASKLVDREGWFVHVPELKELIQQAKTRAIIKSGDFDNSNIIIDPDIEEEEDEAPQPDGDGDTLWGIPGEHLARQFYGDRLGYEVLDSKTKTIDFECRKDNESFEVEVKTIGSKAVRLPFYEWNRLVDKGKSYELLIIYHHGGVVDKIIRVRNVWEIVKEFLSRLGHLSLTDAQRNTNPNVESLLGLQRDIDRHGNPINVIILNWVKLVDELANKNVSLGEVEVYLCNAQLVKGQKSVVDLEWP